VQPPVRRLQAADPRVWPVARGALPDGEARYQPHDKVPRVVLDAEVAPRIDAVQPARAQPRDQLGDVRQEDFPVGHGRLFCALPLARAARALINSRAGAVAAEVAEAVPSCVILDVGGALHLA